MAKKKTQPRRVPRAAEPRMFGDGKASTPATTPQRPASGVSAAEARKPAARPAVTPVRAPITTTQNYAYVLHDLRRLGILAGATFAILIALGLIIR